MDSSELAKLLALAEQLSPERYPERAIILNQRIVQLDPHNAAAYVRLARAYQTQQNYSAAVAACQDALRHHPQSIAAQRRLQRVTEEWELYKEVQTIQTYDEALQRRMVYKDRELIEGVIACLWRALELSASRSQAISCRNALAAAYRSKKDAASLDRALVQYEWVLRQAPGNLTARKGLLAVLRGQRELSQTHLRERRRQEARARTEHHRHQPGDASQRQQQWEQRQQRRKTDQEQAAQPSLKKPATLAEALKMLKLKPPVTRVQIKRAYRKQAQLAHPDHGGSHAAMVALNAAYEMALASA